MANYCGHVWPFFTGTLQKAKTKESYIETEVTVMMRHQVIGPTEFASAFICLSLLASVAAHFQGS